MLVLRKNRRKEKKRKEISQHQGKAEEHYQSLSQQTDFVDAEKIDEEKCAHCQWYKFAGNLSPTFLLLNKLRHWACC